MNERKTKADLQIEPCVELSGLPGVEDIKSWGKIANMPISKKNQIKVTYCKHYEQCSSENLACRGFEKYIHGHGRKGCLSQRTDPSTEIFRAAMENRINKKRKCQTPTPCAK